MLTGHEYFYEEWRSLVRTAARQGPILDLGSPSPFFKELAWLEDCSARPYFCADVRKLPEVDLVCDGRRVPCPDGAFGAVLCGAVLSYVRDPQAIVDEIHRVLRPGGAAYVSLPSSAPHTSGLPGLPGDVLRFAAEAPKVMFDGFSDVRVLRGGNLAQLAWTYLPARLRRPAVQRVVNLVDTRLHTTTTPTYYVLATK
jgi:SAM-dependent methyltransferase